MVSAEVWRGALSTGSVKCYLPTTGKASLSAQAAASIVPAWEKSTVKQPIWPPRNDSTGLLGIRQTFNGKTWVTLVQSTMFRSMSSFQVHVKTWLTLLLCVSPDGVFLLSHRKEPVNPRERSSLKSLNIHLCCVTWDAKASWPSEVVLYWTVTLIAAERNRFNVHMTTWA